MFELHEAIGNADAALVLSQANVAAGESGKNGSAADGTRCGKTFILHDGESHLAILPLVHSRDTFLALKAEHILPSTERMIATGADPPRRLVTEINGEHAAAEYARLGGLTLDELTPTVFAMPPVDVKVGGVPYVTAVALAAKLPPPSSDSVLHG